MKFSIILISPSRNQNIIFIVFTGTCACFKHSLNSIIITYGLENVLVALTKNKEALEI